MENLVIPDELEFDEYVQFLVGTPIGLLATLLQALWLNDETK